MNADDVHPAPGEIDMDAETGYGGWADPEAGVEAEDERAVRRFVGGPGRGLDIRTVRGFVAKCRRLVGPEPLLEPAMDMVLDGVWHEWGVWFRSRRGGEPGRVMAGQRAFAPGLASADAPSAGDEDETDRAPSTATVDSDPAAVTADATDATDAAELRATSEPAGGQRAAIAPATLPPATSMSASPNTTAVGAGPEPADAAAGDTAADGVAQTSRLPASREMRSW